MLDLPGTPAFALCAYREAFDGPGFVDADGANASGEFLVDVVLDDAGDGLCLSDLFHPDDAKTIARVLDAVRRLVVVRQAVGGIEEEDRGGLGTVTVVNLFDAAAVHERRNSAGCCSGWEAGQFDTTDLSR